MADPSELDLERAAMLRGALGKRSLVLVGMMGAGKSSIGRRLGHRLYMPFIDSDAAIEEAAGMTIQEIFANYGETHFRDGERRVIARLLNEGPQVLATGGGSFINEETRANIKRYGISIWLKADLDTLVRRVKRRTNRPLLAKESAEDVVRRLMEARYPIYGESDITVMTRDAPHDVMVEATLAALWKHLGLDGPYPAPRRELPGHIAGRPDLWSVDGMPDPVPGTGPLPS